jgi:glucose/arabinose dehydrogenase
MNGLPRSARTALIVLIPAAFLLASACGGGGGGHGVAKSEVVVPNAGLPIALAVAPDGRLFYGEQTSGMIRVVTADGTLVQQPFAQVQANFAPIEFGLLGLALDPQFESNGYVYAMYTRKTGNETAQPTLVRFTAEGDSGVDPTVIIGDLPETVAKAYFNGPGNIHFGPDGYLYVAVGDYDQGDVAQDLRALNGKILRINKEDGTAPADNPFQGRGDADPRVFAYGLRKVFDFAFNPETEELYAPDGSSDTCDELNIVKAGKNYGWPASYEFRFTSCTEGQPTTAIHFFARKGTKPLDHLSVVNPTGVEFVTADAYPKLGDGLLVCERTSKLMRRLEFEGADQDSVKADDVVVDDCALDIAAGPDGTIYYSNDTEIRRLVAEKATGS